MLWHHLLATHSTNMWLLHHLFIDVNGMMIYQLKYPIIIFLTLVIVTITGSLIAILLLKSMTSVYRKLIPICQRKVEYLVLKLEILINN